MKEKKEASIDWYINEAFYVIDLIENTDTYDGEKDKGKKIKRQCFKWLKKIYVLVDNRTKEKMDLEFRNL